MRNYRFRTRRHTGDTLIGRAKADVSALKADPSALWASSSRGFSVIEALESRVFLSAAILAATDPVAPDPGGGGAVTGQPRITSTNPTDGTTDVPLDSFISAEVSLPVGGIDPSTITSSTVYLVRVIDGSRVPAVVNTSGGGDVVVLRPTQPLQPQTVYEFDATPGIKDVAGDAFAPFQSRFTTGTTTNQIDPQYAKVKFTQSVQSTSLGARYLGVTMGPDHLLYASTDDGRIFRFGINSDGSLGKPQIITSIRDAEGGPRYITGIVFDPASTADNLILWVTQNAAGVLGAPDFTGKVTRLSGPDLGTVQDEVIHLPRSGRDHMTEQCVFGPDGALYISQGSNSSYGDADDIWGNRPEHLLSASILRLDVSAIANSTAPLDALTPDGGGTYNPYVSSAPLTLYATGIRNAYDLLWHSNGQLYVPTNGSAAGGNAPAGPHSPALTNIAAAEPDYIFKITKGRYYGHPDPIRHEYVLNGGNPTAGVDKYEVSQYPVGTLPETNWRSAIYNLGAHESPDGIIEYHGNAFGGVLNHAVLVARYSGGDDIMLLVPSADKQGFVSSQIGLPGMTGMKDPLDLTEDQTSGNIYVAEYNGSASAGDIMLLKVPGSVSAPTPTPTPAPPPPPADTTPPAVITVSAPQITDAGAATELLTVTYSDNTAINTNSIGPDDITVSSKGSFLPVSGTTFSGSGKTVTATYIINAPDGTWSFADNGDYTVNVANGAVLDASNNSTAAKSGQFTVNIAPPPPPVRSRPEQKLLQKIGTYGARHGLTVPDLTYVAGANLKGMFLSLKLEVARLALVAKVTHLAAKKKYPLPDLTNYALVDLKNLSATIKHAHLTT